ncbi:MAG: hypothetical protein FJW34_02115 [Acidobacteria bacterium]|nr:hypothetical protein [Acidobacteriota bacterium]
MSASPYSLEALREYRLKQAGKPAPAPARLADIPPDAPMEEGIVIGCWNGEAFVSWEKWVLSQSVEAFHRAPAQVSSESPPTISRRRPREQPQASSGSLFNTEVNDARAG